MWGGGRGIGGGLIEQLPEERVPEQKTAGDPRVTSRFAVFCRKHSIDELPQLGTWCEGYVSGRTPPRDAARMGTVLRSRCY